jgi:5-methylcytosine-specific restriction protein A
MSLSEIKPSNKERVMDLVEKAGIPTQQWSFKANGEPFSGEPAANPNYCYEWCFRNDKAKVAVLNVWHEQLVEKDGDIQITINIRKVGDESSNTSRKRMAQSMDSLIRVASMYNWTIRAIIMDGRQLNDGTEKASQRMLDEMEWHIRHYDADTGECLLVRGPGKSMFVDQFDLRKEEQNQKSVTANVYERSEQVRRHALERADGNCEYCGELGFMTISGRRYLETHHIEPLSLGGKDDLKNVIALCPHHHRYAHYSQDMESFKNALNEILSSSSTSVIRNNTAR